MTSLNPTDPFPEEPTSAAAPLDPYIGALLSDRYRILRKLGQGAMGSVYLAEHVLIERQVAVKILSGDVAHSPEAMRRFIQEARSAACIGQENIVEIHDFGETESDSMYFAMEYLAGQDLAGLVRACAPLPADRVRHVLTQICRALAAAHEKGIVHRDLKPENIILIERDGRPDFVKVLDFGIAKIMSAEAVPERLTKAGTIIGTPEYMAPEQTRGEATDHRADIYALGCILYEMLTGSVPFLGKTLMEILSKHMFQQPEPPSLRARVPVAADLEAICLRAMAKDPAGRFQSMREMLQALEAAPVAEAASVAPPAEAVSMAPVVEAAGVAPAAPAPLQAVGPSAVTITSVPRALTPLPVAPRRRWPAVAIAAAAVGGVALALLIHRGGAPGAEHPPPAEIAQQTSAVAPAPDQPRPASPEPQQAIPTSPRQSLAPARLVIEEGTEGAYVLLDGTRFLGQVPLDAEVPLPEGVSRQEARVVVRKEGCKEASLETVLVAGEAVTQRADLTCHHGARVKKWVARSVRGQAPAPAPPPTPAAPRTGEPADSAASLKDPFHAR